MIKLFTKIFCSGVPAMAVFCVIACTSENPIFTGTAEEPNQFAQGNDESSSSIGIETSSSIAYSSQEQIHLPQNSSSSKRSQHMSSSRGPQPKSASTVPSSSNTGSPAPHEGSITFRNTRFPASPSTRTFSHITSHINLAIYHKIHATKCQTFRLLRLTGCTK